jgi:glyoxalase family protein
MTKNKTAGIHHVTAIATDPQQNLDFYTEVLGLRLIKTTVNFDDPGTYHLYYGDESGQPGTAMTFFPWPGARRGTRGVGQATITSFSAPEGSIGFWVDKLKDNGVLQSPPERRFDEEALSFLDPDGLKLEIVANAGAAGLAPWREGPIDERFALRGFFGVTLAESEIEPTAALLADSFDMRPEGEQGNRYRYRAGDGGLGSVVDIEHLPGAGFGQISAGTVHHVAFRSADDQTQASLRNELIEQGYEVSPVRERDYFRSIYFREPGGTLFEVATDGPGFTIDEPLAELGSDLKLPAWLEKDRVRIEAALPPLRRPEAAEDRGLEGARQMAASGGAGR